MVTALDSISRHMLARDLFSGWLPRVPEGLGVVEMEKRVS